MLFAENRNSVRKTGIENTVLNALLQIYVRGHLGAHCFFVSEMLASKAPVIYTLVVCHDFSQNRDRYFMTNIGRVEIKITSVQTLC